MASRHTGLGHEAGRTMPGLLVLLAATVAALSGHLVAFVVLPALALVVFPSD